ncbi:hypothetical protein DUI87_14967 [Hirundo rustica rustica]|uniref:Cns1/TTC4 wheel domain-containing protein n=1 Tax=Hirundo rustica rustica TaxID=333673 RepID=A0A3M0K6F5_HIRRU|nr:hypothetical protein DUI87_14967 [Hirundo rustica rustica]
MAEAGRDGVCGAPEPPRYRGALHPDTWEQELEAIPMFMKSCPAQIDPARQPELACLQSLLFDEERSPAELAAMYKNEGNEYFKEKDYGRAVAAYSEGLRRRCGDAELDAVLLANRGAAHFHLGGWVSVFSLPPLQERNIKLVLEPSDEEEEVSAGLAEISLDGFHSDSATGAKVHLDADGNLSWPVLFLYPEHEQTDFTVAFHENSRFIDHLMVMFAELPPWDLEKKYLPNNLELYFEDEEREEMYEVNPDHTLLQMLQHESLSVTAGIHRSFGHSYCTGH